jgi:hypothetical protein
MRCNKEKHYHLLIIPIEIINIIRKKTEKEVTQYMILDKSNIKIMKPIILQTTLH